MPQTPDSPAVLARLGLGVLERIDELTERLIAAIHAEEPVYAKVGTVSDEALWRSCHDNLTRIVQLATGNDAAITDPLDAPRATGTERAQQGMPLESVLHSFRLGGRMIWTALVEQAPPEDRLALLQGSSSVWEVIDQYSGEVATSYRTAERLLLARDQQQRTAALTALFDGQGGEPATAARARRVLGLVDGARLVVVVASGTGRRASDVLGATELRSAWLLREEREVGLVDLAALHPAHLQSLLGGLDRVALSPVTTRISEVAVSLRLAELAFSTLPAGRGAVRLEERLAQTLVAASPDVAGLLVDQLVAPVLALGEEGEELVQTVEVVLRVGGSTGQAAAELYCHRNTVGHRLDRVRAVTGLDVLSTPGRVQWALALLACGRYAVLDG